MEHLIKITHLLLIGFVLYAPFSKSIALIDANILLIIFMLLSWSFGYQCFLTKLESIVSGRPYTQGFLYRLFNGAINMQENQFNILIITVTAIWLVVNIFIRQQYTE